MTRRLLGPHGILCVLILFVVYGIFPEIIVELFDQLENENNSASFTCQATGEPIPNISWYFNDVMINVSDTSKYRIESKIATIEDTLEVFNVTSSDVGSYICMATNELGNDSSIGILTVNSKKMFSTIVWSVYMIMSCYYRCC